MEKTTIQVNQSTLNRLKMLRNVDKQSYDDILNNLIDNIEEETLSEEEIKDIVLLQDNSDEDAFWGAAYDDSGWVA